MLWPHLNATQRMNADCGFYYYLRGLILLSTFLVKPRISPQLQRVCGNAQENPKISVLQMLCGNSQDNPRINPTAAKALWKLILKITQESIPLLQRLCGESILLMNPTTAYTGYVENFTRIPASIPPKNRSHRCSSYAETFKLTHPRIPLAYCSPQAMPKLSRKPKQCPSMSFSYSNIIGDHP